jgi:hypothetical protein
MRYLLFSLVAFSLAWSAPALPGERIFVQPDGTTFKGRAQGDEFLHWIETEEGEVLLFSKERRRFERAQIRSGQLRPSGVPFVPGTDAPESAPRPDMESLYQLWNAKRSDAFRHAPLYVPKGP